MCGLGGVFEKKLRLDASKHLQELDKKIKHRGPDYSGFIADESIVLFHHRLSIIDLSFNANQPMRSDCGNYIIAFNGEIYNFKELERELSGKEYVSDTCLLLDYLIVFGIDRLLEQARGMFAFAFYSCVDAKLILARDRFGEKPLYYYRPLNSERVIFGSDLAYITELSNTTFDLSHSALGEYFTHNYISENNCIFEGVSKVLPGTYMMFTGSEETTIVYWDAVASKNKVNRVNEVGSLKKLLLDVVDEVSVSDVPIGSFLSGGIDSSLVTALFNEVSIGKIETFTVGFSKSDYDESQFALKVASKLGVNNHLLVPNDDDVFEVVNSLSRAFTEPFADSSQIPTMLVSQLASKHVRVVLSGDGGDELFGGYNRYFMTSKYWKKINLLPVELRKVLASLALMTPDSLTSFFLKSELKEKACLILDSKDNNELYAKLISHELSNDSILQTKQYKSIIRNLDPDIVNNMMLNDVKTYLPSDILTKVDRSSMFYSIESRVPFLDVRVYDYAWALGLEEKINGGSGKLPLKNILQEYLGNSLVQRPKMGFGFPLEEYLVRGRVNEWVNDLLDYSDDFLENLIHIQKLKIYMLELKQGKNSNKYKLWNGLVFINWYMNNKHLLNVN